MLQTLRWLLFTRLGRRWLRTLARSALVPPYRPPYALADGPRQLDASLLQAQLDRIGDDGAALVRHRGEPQGAVPGPAVAFLEAFHIGHLLPGGVNSLARDLHWSRLPEGQHIRADDDTIIEEDKVVRTIEQIALSRDDTTAWHLHDWLLWLLRTQNQIKPIQHGDNVDNWHFRGHTIYWGFDEEKVTGPDPEQVIDLSELVFRTMAQAASPFVRGAILEHGLQTVQPWPGWHNAAHILAANLVTRGRNIPSAVTEYWESKARLNMLRDGPALPWLELRYDRHVASGRVPTHDTLAAIESWTVDGYDYDPIMGGPKRVAEHTHHLLVELRRTLPKG